MKTVAVIGAGASGIMASIFAAKNNCRVTLFEKQNKTGRKILSTGNGRCNISNRNIDIGHYHGHNPKFILNVFARFGLNETLEFFESIGIPVIEEDEGRLFPASLQASGVVDILNYELNKNDVVLSLNRQVDKIERKSGKFAIVTAGKEEHLYDAVILSAGSVAYGGLGASDIGYNLARSLGHKVNQPSPAIVPINVPLKAMHTLEGVKWNCSVKAELNGKTLCESSGELLFTKYGISGPAALNISREVNLQVASGKIPHIIIDFFPGHTVENLQDKFRILWKDPEKNICLSLSGIIKKRIPEVLLKIINIDPYKQVKNLTETEKSNIINIFKNLKLTPGNPRSFKEAVVAAGGVDVNEINPSTMESGVVKNLYITGELLDIDGDSGGYNLQFAWSTGAVAGMSQ